ncbi:hypothetical protein GF420_03050 [candidate division GN15 bacterium]|nr:hypothetical protein [candidate division GN15 bacterium]
MTTRFFGDFRFRHEVIDTENSPSRSRQRVCAHFGVEVGVSPVTKVRFKLSTGGDDPISCNQTIGEAFTTKNMRIDLAYAELTPSGLNRSSLKIGKTDLPFWKPGKSELVWDSDLNPEGMTGRYRLEGTNIRAELTAGGYLVEERAEHDNTYLTAGQMAVHIESSHANRYLSLGAAYYHYGNIRGFAPIYDDSGFGNRLDSSGVFLRDYRLVQAGLEAMLFVADVPLLLAVDAVANTAVSSARIGWLIGGRFGDAEEVGNLEFWYNYRRVESDAVFGTFTDSDFAGGGTDGRGHELGGMLVIGNGLSAAATFFHNQTAVNGGPTYQRLQLDFRVRF